MISMGRCGKTGGTYEAVVGAADGLLGTSVASEADDVDGVAAEADELAEGACEAEQTTDGASRGAATLHEGSETF